MKIHSRRGSAKPDAVALALTVFIIFAIFLLIIIPLILFAVAENKDKTNLSQTTTETGNGEIFSKKGSYSLFRTRNMEEYLNFLDNFDDDRFEIVDISTSYHITSDGSDEFYMVTYRAKG